MDLRREADQVGELPDRIEVAPRGEALEAERIEVVPGQQTQVRVGTVDQPRRLVVQQVALSDRLDQERVLARRVRGAGPGGDEGAERRLLIASRTYGEMTFSPSRSSDARALRGVVIAAMPMIEISAGQLKASSKAPPAASIVRSIDSSSWASEGNQASNWEAGG